MSAPVRGLRLATVACVAGGAVILFAVGRAWVSFQVAESGLPSLRGHASGHVVAGAVLGFALVGLAGAVALIATRRYARLAVAAVLVAVGVATVVAAARVLAGPAHTVAGEVTRLAGHADATVSSVSTSGWPWVALAGGVLIAVSGGFAALRGRDWPSMGRRYRRGADGAGGADCADGAAAKPQRRDRELDLWDALDRGEDPTA